MEDKEFRYSILKPAIEQDKAALCRLTTGKHQLRGFRNLAKAPSILIIPVLSDEANVSAELAEAILRHWLKNSSSLQEVVSAKLNELGYEVNTETFDVDGLIAWKPMANDHAQLQFDGKFLEGEDSNAVMLMSLLLGWFGSDKDNDPSGKEKTE